jgi:hypothetical protein
MRSAPAAAGAGNPIHRPAQIGEKPVVALRGGRHIAQSGITRLTDEHGGR